MRPVIEIRDLGTPDVSVGGDDPPRELLWRKNLGLLVYLARSTGRTRTREHLTGLLWGESEESSARHSLNEALRTLRRHGTGDLVVSDGERVSLDGDLLRLDSQRLETWLEEERFEEASGLVRGLFMEGFGVPDANRFEDWLAAERVHWRQRSVDALVGWAEACLRAGDLAEARRSSGRALTLEPMSAAGTRALMRVTALSGERAAALQVYEDYAGRTREELGIDPDPETRRLADRIHRDRTWKLPESLAPEVHSRGTLPLFGRSRELEGLAEAWTRAAERDVTSLLVVEGEAGSGRSRMLEELASRARLDGAVVAAARTVPDDRDAPWSGIVALCRDDLASAPGLVVAPPEALAGVARRLPAWRERFADEIGDADPVEPGRALVELLRVVSDEGPVLLCLDDARWCDARSLRALRALLRDLEDRPVCLAVTVTDRPGPPELDALRSELGHDLEGAVVRLDPLEADELRSMAAHELPDWEPSDLDRLARRLAADSAGLPLLAVELLHGVKLGLELEGDRSAWPDTRRTLDQTRPGELPDPVVGAIRTGYWALSEPARETVLAAAALGDRTAEAELQRATQLGASELQEALDELEWARWLTSDGRGYSFVARIVREVLVEDMLTPGRLRRLRERAGADPSS